jgi:hypothetical protein
MAGTAAEATADTAIAPVASAAKRALIGVVMVINLLLAGWDNPAMSPFWQPLGETMLNWLDRIRSYLPSCL